MAYDFYARDIEGCCTTLKNELRVGNEQDYYRALFFLILALYHCIKNNATSVDPASIPRSASRYVDSAIGLLIAVVKGTQATTFWNRNGEQPTMGSLALDLYLVCGGTMKDFIKHSEVVVMRSEGCRHPIDWYEHGMSILTAHESLLMAARGWENYRL